MNNNNNMGMSMNNMAAILMDMNNMIISLKNNINNNMNLNKRNTNLNKINLEKISNDLKMRGLFDLDFPYYIKNSPHYIALTTDQACFLLKKEK